MDFEFVIKLPCGCGRTSESHIVCEDLEGSAKDEKPESEEPRRRGHLCPSGVADKLSPSSPPDKPPLEPSFQMSISTVSNELLLLIAQQLQSQKDLKALIKVNHRFYHLLKHLLYRYNLRHQNGDGILQAAKLGSIPAVAQFIKEGYRVKGQPVHDQEHLPDRFGNQVLCSCHLEHPILDAAEHGHSALVKYLLSAGSEPDLESNLGETPTHLAAKNGFSWSSRSCLTCRHFPCITTLYSRWLLSKRLH
jgi:hypothetical protein